MLPLPSTSPSLCRSHYPPSTHTAITCINEPLNATHSRSMFQGKKKQTKRVRPTGPGNRQPQNRQLRSRLPLHICARPPQFRYHWQASAEDQFLTKRVMGWILEGKLNQINPLHTSLRDTPRFTSWHSTRHQAYGSLRRNPCHIFRPESRGDSLKHFEELLQVRQPA